MARADRRVHPGSPSLDPCDGPFYSPLGAVDAEPAIGSSIVRALRVVEAVAAAGDGVTAKAIARRLGSPLPTVYRALGVLVEEGYLVRLHDVRGYGLGYRVAELQRGLVEQLRPAAGVRSILYEVHTTGRAAAYLVVPRDVDMRWARGDCGTPRPDASAREPTRPRHRPQGAVGGARPARPVAELLTRPGAPVAPHGGRPEGLDRS